MPKRDKPPVTFFGRAVTIACTDLHRSEVFYVSLLGATLIPGDGHGCPWYQLGSLTISLLENAAHESPATFPEHAMPVLWLEVDDVRLAHEHLKNAGTPIIQAPDDNMFMMIADPDGLVIEIWQHDNEKTKDGS